MAGPVVQTSAFLTLDSGDGGGAVDCSGSFGSFAPAVMRAAVEAGTLDGDIVRNIPGLNTVECPATLRQDGDLVVLKRLMVAMFGRVRVTFVFRSQDASQSGTNPTMTVKGYVLKVPFTGARGEIIGGELQMTFDYFSWADGTTTLSAGVA